MDTAAPAKKDIEVQDMLLRMVEKKASDLFVTAGVAPCIKVHGKLHPIDDTPLTPERTRELVLSIMSESQRKEYVRSHECNFAISSRGIGRFRVSAFTSAISQAWCCGASRPRSPQSRNSCSRPS